MEIDEGSDQTSDIHANLKNEFTEDKKCQNLMSWFIYLPTHVMEGFRFRNGFGHLHLSFFTSMVLQEGNILFRKLKVEELRLMYTNAFHAILHAQSVLLSEINGTPKTTTKTHDFSSL